MADIADIPLDRHAFPFSPCAPLCSPALSEKDPAACAAASSPFDGVPVLSIVRAAFRRDHTLLLCPAFSPSTLSPPCDAAEGVLVIALPAVLLSSMLILAGASTSRLCRGGRSASCSFSGVSSSAGCASSSAPSADALLCSTPASLPFPALERSGGSTTLSAPFMHSSMASFSSSSSFCAPPALIPCDTRTRTASLSARRMLFLM
mmetsp:Transcript_42329/g.133362  ORF Transcript_42329/g.133362 Transcript_42329/m.133362 type:complete len:205 (-) Transcript_42329:986-1600(-)